MLASAPSPFLGVKHGCEQCSFVLRHTQAQSSPFLAFTHILKAVLITLLSSVPPPCSSCLSLEGVACRPRASGEQPHLDKAGRACTSLCLLILKGSCRMCKAKHIPRSSHLCCCCHTTSFTEGILQRISLCAPQFSTGIYTSDMNLLTQKFTRCVNRFRDH